MKEDPKPEKRSGDPRYRHLPEPVHLEDTVAEQEVRPVPDPDLGMDPDQLFLLRYGAL